MMADAPHPRDADAVAYVTGTMSRAERRAFADAMAADPALARAVLRWEEALVPLTDAVEEVNPAPEIWTHLERRLGPARAASADPRLLATIRRSRARWRMVAGGFAALAAALVVAIGMRWERPATSGALVAVVNRTGDLPALIVRVEPASGIVQVRSLAAETPSGHSLELWSVQPGASPRSLGLVSGPMTRIPLPAGRDRPHDGVVIAVSVEPSGGSPTGAPTGPVVYSGRLVPEMP